MDKFYLCVLCCFVLFWDIGSTLRCRTGNEEDNEQYYKVMENCRKRYSMQNDRNMGSNSDESSNSDEDNFDKRVMSNGRFGSDSVRGLNGFRNNYRSRDWDNRGSSSDFYNRNMSRKMARDYDDQRFRSNRRQNNWHFTNGGNYDRRYDDGQNNGGYDNSQDQSCVTQCFFNELNLVDQRGYPDRTAVNSILLEDIQDPELRDFVEEAVVQCFHYLNLEGKQNNCQYSQNLLSCLIEKGEERCDDWNSRYK